MLYGGSHILDVLTNVVRLVRPESRRDTHSETNQLEHQQREQDAGSGDYKCSVDTLQSQDEEERNTTTNQKAEDE